MARESKQEPFQFGGVYGSRNHTQRFGPAPHHAFTKALTDLEIGANCVSTPVVERHRCPGGSSFRRIELAGLDCFALYFNTSLIFFYRFCAIHHLKDSQALLLPDGQRLTGCSKTLLQGANGTWHCE
jgi:hypothetical protein